MTESSKFWDAATMYCHISSLLTPKVCAFVVSITHTKDIDGHANIRDGIALLQRTFNSCIAGSDVEIFVPRYFSVKTAWLLGLTDLSSARCELAGEPLSNSCILSSQAFLASSDEPMLSYFFSAKARSIFYELSVHSPDRKDFVTYVSMCADYSHACPFSRCFYLIFDKFCHALV